GSGRGLEPPEDRAMAEHDAIERGKALEISGTLAARRCGGVEPFQRPAAAGEVRHGHALRNAMISAARPGPNDMAQPLAPRNFAHMSFSSTNITVADDMLPYCRSTLREAESASPSRSSARSTASSTVRPPGCTAQVSIARAPAPLTMSPACACKPSWMAF